MRRADPGVDWCQIDDVIINLITPYCVPGESLPMLARHLSESVLSAAAQNPVVTLMGPRQSGKTTLCQMLFPDHEYLSLEAPDVRSRAIEDPRSFLASENDLVIDEIQRAPDLLSYIQVAVDENPRPGRFVLTGSQNLLLMESVSQTLETEDDIPCLLAGALFGTR